MNDVRMLGLDSVEAGAPANEIEVTPEMIEAGVGVLLAMDTRLEMYEDVVKEVIESVFKNNLRGAHIA